MIWLVDNQLPPALATRIKKFGVEALHVSACGLDRSSDTDIWKYAKDHDCIIVSKDEDFFHLSGTDPEAPPVVWVRLGNCRKETLFASFDKIMPNIIEAIAGGAKVIELR